MKWVSSCELFCLTVIKIAVENANLLHFSSVDVLISKICCCSELKRGSKDCRSNGKCCERDYCALFQF